MKVDELSTRHVRLTANRQVGEYVARRVRFSRHAITQARTSGPAHFKTAEAEAMADSGEPCIVSDWFTGEIVSINVPALEILGERPSSIAGRQVWQYLSAEQEATTLAQRVELWRRGETSETVEILRRDGQSVSVSMRSALGQIGGRIRVFSLLRRTAEKIFDCLDSDSC